MRSVASIIIKSLLDTVPRRISADKQQSIKIINLVFGKEDFVIEIAYIALHVLKRIVIEGVSKRNIVGVHANK